MINSIFQSSNAENESELTLEDLESVVGGGNQSVAISSKSRQNLKPLYQNALPLPTFDYDQLNSPPQGSETPEQETPDQISLPIR